MCEEVTEDSQLLVYFCYSNEYTFFLRARPVSRMFNFDVTLTHKYLGIPRSSIVPKLMSRQDFLKMSFKSSYFARKFNWQSLTQDANYLITIQILENSIIFSEDQIICKQNIVFQQNNCPAHLKKKKISEINLIRMLQIDEQRSRDSFQNGFHVLQIQCLITSVKTRKCQNSNIINQ